ncbi:hypothetical protein JCM39068_34510 [Desulfocastanea catecholica]
MIGTFFLLNITDISVHFARAAMDRYKNETLISREMISPTEPLQSRPSGRVNINFHAIKFNLCNYLLCIDNLHIDIFPHMLDYTKGNGGNVT